MNEEKRSREKLSDLFSELPEINGGASRSPSQAPVELPGYIRTMAAATYNVFEGMVEAGFNVFAGMVEAGFNVSQAARILPKQMEPVVSSKPGDGDE